MLKHVFGGCKNEQKSTKEMLKKYIVPVLLHNDY